AARVQRIAPQRSGDRAQPLVRRPAAARGRSGARHRAEAHPARRADRRDEPAGNRRVHRLRGPASCRPRAHRPAHRARHAGRHGRLRPRDRPRLRREDRRGLAGRDPEERAGHRGLPRQRGGDDGLSTPETILELQGVETYYGSIQALKGISIDVRDGEIVTLIGANGAGKSTTLRSINGLNHPRKGKIRFEGRDITNDSPHSIVRKGIAQSPEGRKLFPRMSVTENLEMGAFQRSDRAGIREDMDRVFTLFPRLAERRTQKAGTMSGGEQQMCAIGRALMARPTLLMLDEPSMGLAPIFVERIFETIVEVNKQGTSILLVEQNALMALHVANRGYVLETGTVALADDAKALA